MNFIHINYSKRKWIQLQQIVCLLKSLKILMLNQQKKKLQSLEKDIAKNISDPHFPKSSSSNQNYKARRFFEAKSYKRLIQIQIPTSQQALQSDSRSKQFSFLRFIPSTTKNVSNKHQESPKNIKQIKIPSFFKKPKKQKQIQQNSQSFQKQMQVKSFIKGNKTVSNGTFLQKSVGSNKETSYLSHSAELISGKLSEYNKLNNKINYLLSKISFMKVILDNKRQEKLVFMQIEKQQRANTIISDYGASTCSSIDASLKQFITQAPQHKDLHAFTQNPYSPRHSIYYVSQILKAYKQQKSLARQHILSSIQYLRMFHHTNIPQEKSIEHMKVILPRAKGYEDKKTVIFDLDETLIHCNQNVYMPSDFKIKVNFPTGEIIQVGINVRPFAREILAALSKNFQVIVFTASHSCYANVVLDNLDPERKYIQHRLFRQNCYCTQEGIYVKDLRIINRPLWKIILVDNAAYSYAYQPLNGVPIIPYYQGKNDYELPSLQKYIQSLLFSVDVRQKNRKTFKFDKYHQFDDLNTLVETLYSSNGAH